MKNYFTSQSLFPCLYNGDSSAHPALYHYGNEITFSEYLAQGLAHKPYQQMTSGLKLDRPAIKKKKDIKELTGSPYHLSNNTPFRCPAAKER